MFGKEGRYLHYAGEKWRACTEDVVLSGSESICGNFTICIQQGTVFIISGILRQELFDSKRFGPA